MSEQANGDTRESTVLFWLDSKGWGMLRHPDHPDRQPDVFCHWSCIQGDGYKTLRLDQRVEFLMIEGKDGRPAAVQVRPL